MKFISSVDYYQPDQSRDAKFFLLSRPSMVFLTVYKFRKTFITLTVGSI